MNLLDRLGRRPAIIASGWVIAAVLAVLAGLVGINVIGNGLTSRQAASVDEAEIIKELSGLAASASSSASSSPPAVPSPAVPPSPLFPSASPAPSFSGSPALPSEPAATPSRTASLGSRPDATTSLRTRGGTVVAECAGIISMAPAQGFAVHEQRTSEGEFRGVRDSHDRVKLDLSCTDGVPRVSVR